jgi:hypothetical protein
MGNSDEGPARDELVKLEKEIARVEKEVGDFAMAYESAVGPNHQVGMHRSIWNATADFRDPFLEAVNRLNLLKPRRREAQGRVERAGRG